MIHQTRRELFAGAAAALFARRLAALPLAKVNLGVTTDEIDDDVEVAAKFLESFGLKWAEVRNIWGKYNTELPIEKIRDTAAIFERHGIRVASEDSALFRGPLPPDTPEGRKQIDDQWPMLDLAIERAKVFGATKIRIFGFTLAGGEPPSERSNGRIYEYLQEATRRAKKGGVRIAMENLEKAHIATGAQAAEALKHVKDGHFGLTWDPNNAAQSGEQSFPEGYRKLDPARIFHVHLRDYRHQDGRVVWTAVGDGEFDNLGQIRALVKDGYKETFSLETHWRDGKSKASSSATSLQGLLKVIEKV